MFFAIAVIASLGSLGHRKLANPDEGRYSEIAREMAQSGDFVTPRLNGLKYFEKPPLQYWATAIAFKVFGENEFAARLYTALCGLGCILLVGYAGRRLYDQETALLSALVLMSAPYFAALAEIATLDMGLTFWLTLSVTSFLIAQQVGSESSRRRWLLAAWGGMAGAMLSKGLVGIVFPAAALLLYCITHRDFRLIRQLQWARGLLLFAALTAPWFIAVSRQNPEFAQFFFVHEHFERFLTTQHRREESWWYFFPILFAGFLPWTFALVPAAASGWKHAAHLSRRGASFSPLKFVVLFTVFILLFFSKSGSKLPAYILPMFPLLALTMGAYLRHCAPRALSWMVLPVVPLALWGTYAAWQAPAAKAANLFARALYESMSFWAVAASLLLALCALFAFLLLRFRRKWAGILVLAGGSIVSIEFVEYGYEHISPLQSGAGMAAAIKPRITPETRLYSVDIYDQSLPFYLKRTLTLVNYSDEFAPGLKAEPEKSIARLADFPAAWQQPGAAVAIIQPGHLDKMRELGLSFEIIHSDPRRMAIIKTSPP